MKWVMQHNLCAIVYGEKNELTRQRPRLQGALKNLLLKLFFRQFNDMPIQFVGKPQNREIWVEMEKRQFKD